MVYTNICRRCKAASSSSRPWIDVFSYTRKIQHGARSEKCQNLLIDCATSELSVRAWSWNVTDSKQTIFDLIIPRYIQIWQSKEMSHNFVRGQSVAETCFRLGIVRVSNLKSCDEQRFSRAFLCKVDNKSVFNTWWTPCPLANLFIFHPLEVARHYSNPQFQVGEITKICSIWDEIFGNIDN